MVRLGASRVFSARRYNSPASRATIFTGQWPRARPAANPEGCRRQYAPCQDIRWLDTGPLMPENSFAVGSLSRLPQDRFQSGTVARVELQGRCAPCRCHCFAAAEAPTPSFAVAANSTTSPQGNSWREPSEPRYRSPAARSAYRHCGISPCCWTTLSAASPPLRCLHSLQALW